jgi:hypothetical protein
MFFFDNLVQNLGYSVNNITLMRSGDRLHFYISFVFLLISTSVHGQAGKSHTYRFGGDLCTNITIDGSHSFTIDYKINELNIEGLVNDNGEFYRITVPGHISTSDPGKPQLPVFSRLISVPGSSSYNIKISEVTSTKISPGKKNFRGLLFPAQPGQTKNPLAAKQGFMIDNNQYNTPGILKTDTVSIINIGRLRKNNLAGIVIRPVQFNPRANEIMVITSMKIDISFTEPLSKTGALPDHKGSPVFEGAISKSLLNFNPEEVITGYSDQPLKMIILTDTVFSKHLQPLIRWKTQKGFKINVLFRGTGMAGTNYAELKDTLTKIYNSSTADNPPPEYLMIVGDINKIPAVSGISNVSDMYYGEFDGDGDFIPDMFIGRLPVADTSELKAVVNKMIQYEKFEFTDTNTFHARTLFTAGNDNSYAGHMNRQVKYAVTNYLTTDNNINEYHFYNPLSTEPFIEDSIKYLINRKGISFLNYSGHGDAQGWLDPKIKVPEVDLLDNRNMYPFIISNACKTAQFSASPSFSNKMLVSDKKGAIGFIGCTNDSYWDEDYYWTVGLGSPLIDPTYENTGLGAYDRLFHTHGESPSDWFITMGQINYAGNLAVSASTSSYKKYYWETYSLLGDPSMIPIIGTPGTFQINLPDTLPNGMYLLHETIEPFAYMAISRHDTLIDASFASASGAISLDLPGLIDDSCLIVVTGQNKKPFLKTVYFGEKESEYISLSSVTFNDSLGNGNGKTDISEAVFLNLVVSNLGQTTTSDLYAKISTNSSWLTLETDSFRIGNLPPKSEYLLKDILKFKIADYVPDMGVATIDLLLKDSGPGKNYRIDICIHAPKLEIINCKTDDSAAGNSNNVPDPGETLDLIFRVFNSGSSDISGTFAITDPPAEMTIINNPVSTGIIKHDMVTDIRVKVKIAASVMPGTSMNISTLLDCAPYLSDKDFTISVGMTRESFENQSFSVFPWKNSSQYPWVISDKASYEGSFSARSGIIPHNAETVLAININSPVADTVRFMTKVSSERNYDFLYFYLNKKEIFKISGETSWQPKEAVLAEGHNLLEWIYRKDVSKTEYSDCAWLDYISFPVLSFMKTDIKLSKVTIPVPEKGYRHEIVSADVINFGRDTLDGFNLAYQVNELGPVSEFFNKMIYPGDTLSVAFSQTADLSHGGTYDIKVFSLNNNDLYPRNDTASTVIVNTAIEQPQDDPGNDIIAAPNPFSDHFRIFYDSDIPENILLRLFDSTGRKILEEVKAVMPGENILFVPGANLHPGVYTLSLSGKTGSGTLRIIKIR